MVKVYTFQALKIAFPTGTFLKNGIVQGIKVSTNSFLRSKYLPILPNLIITFHYPSPTSGYSLLPVSTPDWRSV